MRVTEMFVGIDGEVNAWGQGTMTSFVRLAGCNLKCSYCDTALAHAEGKEISVGEIIHQLGKMGCRKVTITGGEPMMQDKEVYRLLNAILEGGYFASIETNGTMSVSTKYLRRHHLCWVVDYKLDYDYLMCKPLFANLGAGEFVKIVVQDEDEVHWAMQIKNELTGIGCMARFAVSPMFDRHGAPLIQVQKVIDILQHIGQTEVMINVQLHKFLGVS